MTHSIDDLQEALEARRAAEREAQRERAEADAAEREYLDAEREAMRDETPVAAESHEARKRREGIEMLSAGHTFAAVISHLHGAIERPPPFAVVPPAELFGPLPPISYVVEGLDVCPGAPVLVAGAGFSGKTVALQSAALSIATGRRVWGEFGAPTGRILHLDYEQGKRITAERYQRLARGMGIDAEQIGDHLAVAPMPGLYLDGDGAHDALAKASEGFALVLVDSLRAACPSIEENSSDARRVLDVMTRVSEKTGAVFVVVHHARKPSQDASGGARYTMRGSGAIFDAAGSVLIFSADKGEPTRVQHEKARTSGILAPDFYLRIEDVEVDGDPRGGLGVAFVEAEEIKPRERPGDAFKAAQRRVLEYVRSNPGAGGKVVIREALGMRMSTVSAAIEELLASGAIVNLGTAQRPRLRVHSQGVTS